MKFSNFSADFKFIDEILIKEGKVFRSMDWKNVQEGFPWPMHVDDSQNVAKLSHVNTEHLRYDYHSCGVETKSWAAQRASTSALKKVIPRGSSSSDNSYQDHFLCQKLPATRYLDCDAVLGNQSVDLCKVSSTTPGFTHGEDWCNKSNHAYKEESFPSPQYIELGNVALKLRGTKETKEAIRVGFYVPCKCSCCSFGLFCIQDAEFVICPECRQISPIKDFFDGVGGGASA